MASQCIRSFNVQLQARRTSTTAFFAAADQKADVATRLKLYQDKKPYRQPVPQLSLWDRVPVSVPAPSARTNGRNRSERQLGDRTAFKLLPYQGLRDLVVDEATSPDTDVGAELVPRPLPQTRKLDDLPGEKGQDCATSECPFESYGFVCEAVMERIKANRSAASSAD